MSYSPTIGRFLERDPIGEVTERSQVLTTDPMRPSGLSLAMADVTLLAMASAFDQAALKFGAEAVKSNPRLMQYARGSNTYEFVSSNPLNGTDPSGLDRYVGSDARLHYYVVIDDWQMSKGPNGCPCWKKVGQTRYDFRLKYNTWLAPINAVGAITFSGSGDVGATPYTGTPHYTIASTPEADEWLKTQMQAMGANPPNYHAFFYNCNWWVENWKNEGIQQTAGKKGLPVCP